MPKINYLLKLKGTVGGWNFDADYVDFKLSQHKDEEVHVLIDSLGGDVATALSICHAFKNHGKVTVHFAGLNASAATIASLGAAHICIDANAMYLVHKVSTDIFKWTSMNADALADYIAQLDKAKNDLEKFDLNIASMYATKCKKSKEDLLNLMKKEVWQNAEDAKDWGFVDEIENAEEKENHPKLSASLAASMQANGIPLPDIPIERDLNVIQSIYNKVCAMFDSLAKVKQTPKNGIMKKVFLNIGKLLNVAEFTADEGNINVTEAQMQTIEDNIVQLNDRIAQLEDDVKKKDEQIAALQKAPGAETHQVNSSGGAKEENNEISAYVEVSKQAENLYKLLN